LCMYTSDRRNSAYIPAFVHADLLEKKEK
jgi:hypothetical protein